MNSGAQLITASKLVLPDIVLDDAGLFIKDGQILAVGPRESLPYDPNAQTVNFDGKILAPSLIDLHIHGQKGYEVGPDSTAISVIANTICHFGVTAFLPILSFAPTPRELCDRLKRTVAKISSQKCGA